MTQQHFFFQNYTNLDDDTRQTTKTLGYKLFTMTPNLCYRTLLTALVVLLIRCLQVETDSMIIWPQCLDFGSIRGSSGVGSISHQLFAWSVT